jgi:hypothetical protein
LTSKETKDLAQLIKGETLTEISYCGDRRTRACRALSDHGERLGLRRIHPTRQNLQGYRNSQKL